MRVDQFEKFICNVLNCLNSLFDFSNLYMLCIHVWFVRGTNGVWTLEQKGLKPTMNISFDEAIPTKTHMALKKLVDASEYNYDATKRSCI